MTRHLTGSLAVTLALLFTIAGAASMHGVGRTSVVLAVPATKRRNH